MARFADTRPPAVAGQFYPRSPEALQAQVDACLEQAGQHLIACTVRALIAPHAGYQFSGRTAAHAFRLLKARNDVTRVVVLAPGHRSFARGASVGDYARFATPLGDLHVDVETCQRLLECPQITAERGPHRDEHALEVQLPFIQNVLPEARLVPLVCGQMDLKEIRTLGATLARELWQRDTVWVVSSDFTHYGHAFGYAPFTEHVPERIEELDKGAIDCILRLDCEAFLEYVARTGATICGRLPIALLLAALEEAQETPNAEMLHYTNSGKLTQDFTHSVSYAAIALCDPADGARPETLSCEERRALLELARASIRSQLHGEAEPQPSAGQLSAALRKEAACFVTLHLAGKLRGCIGYLEASEPLHENVVRNARSAAFSDHRFAPLTAEELTDVDIEISVLTPNMPIARPEQFIVGRHGIIIQKRGRRAVFLPQVAPEQGWDRETTLQYLCRKAGLKSDDWRRGAELSVFEAIVFGENNAP